VTGSKRGIHTKPKLMSVCHVPHEKNKISAALLEQKMTSQTCGAESYWDFLHKNNGTSMPSIAEAGPVKDK
jgi:hypothetical protein